MKNAAGNRDEEKARTRWIRRVLLLRKTRAVENIVEHFENFNGRGQNAKKM